MIKKNEKGYAVDIRPAGRDGPRFRKTFASKAEAIAYEKWVTGKHFENPDWLARQQDNRRLSDLVNLWYELHGKTIKTGHRRLGELKTVIDLMDDPTAAKFDAKLFSKTRAKRLETVSENTANHDLTNFKALFNELIRLGEYKGSNPLANIRKIKLVENELTYLTREQIDLLLRSLDEHTKSHARISARICLMTGARWGEACAVKESQVRNGQITFAGKNGKNRSVPITKDLLNLIRKNAPLKDGMKVFKKTVASIELDLPRGQMTHVLRHTFASHFMINGGNIIALQKILGHGSLAMTMRYAHLSPDHLQEVLTLNPLA